MKFSPWTGDPYKDAAEKNALGGLSLDGFLSEVWIFVSAFSASTYFSWTVGMNLFFPILKFQIIWWGNVDVSHFMFPKTGSDTMSGADDWYIPKA